MISMQSTTPNDFACTSTFLYFLTYPNVKFELGFCKEIQTERKQVNRLKVKMMIRVTFNITLTGKEYNRPKTPLT